MPMTEVSSEPSPLTASLATSMPSLVLSPAPLPASSSFLSSRSASMPSNVTGMVSVGFDPLGPAMSEESLGEGVGLGVGDPLGDRGGEVGQADRPPLVGEHARG